MEADWYCKVDGGPAGISLGIWTPDGSGVLIVSEFCVRLTAWSLVKPELRSHLPPPKRSSRDCLKFGQKSLLAELYRRDCRDELIFIEQKDDGQWLVKNRVVLKTTDARCLEWNPQGNCVCIMDSYGSDKLAVVITIEGQLLVEFKNKNFQGIKHAQWSCAGELLAMQTYGKELLVLNHLTWQPILDEVLSNKIMTGCEDLVVYREVNQDDENVLNVGNSSFENRTRFDVCNLPVQIMQRKEQQCDTIKSKKGFLGAQFDPSNTFLFVYTDCIPNVAWIWNVRTMSLSTVLIFQDPLQSVEWEQNQNLKKIPRLALVTGVDRLYLWTPDGASCVQLPLQNFCARVVQWRENKKQEQGGTLGLLLNDIDSFCCGYLT